MAIHEFEFVNTRIKFKRANDDTEFHGWVEKFNTHNLTVNIDKNKVEEVTPSELYTFEAVGNKKKLFFTAGLDGIIENNLTFYIMGGIRDEESDEPYRIKVKKMYGKVSHADETHEVELENISAGGLCFLSNKSFEVDTEIQGKFTIKNGLVEFDAVVKHSEPSGVDDRLQIGAMITSISRVDSKRWNLLLEQSEQKA